MNVHSDQRMQRPERTIQIRSGNEMIAEGALRAGCRFFAGYPITPASGIYEMMMNRLPERKGVAISAPDEISAICYCVGASMQGAKAMTATSGPGWALMIETVQYALMTETPLVVAFVQRLGPSTGGATQGAQGDLLLAEFCTSGGYAIPVFCPSNPIECFELTVRAFNWAERLRTPVVLLTDKETAMTYESVNLADIHDFPNVERPRFVIQPGNGQFQTYGFHAMDDVPDFAPLAGPSKVTATGSMHDKSGRLRKNSPESLAVLHHLQAKIVERADDIAIATSDLQEGAETLVLSYGITARTAREAVDRARAHGKKVSWLNVLSLFPIPQKEIVSAIRGIRKVVVPEENITGQYRMMIRHLLGNREIVGINHIGRMITPSEILQEIE
jgi:2-oxoglutarate ferredoxin oxidoreductase subunit alpha